MLKRCEWAKSELMQEYHDDEWGKEIHDDKKLFEMLILEGAQAGLSWETILKRKITYKKAFDNFNIKKISKYTEKDFERLMDDSGIIRNKLKILSAVNNAKQFLKIQKEFGSFDKYIWSFVDYKPIINKFVSMKNIPVNTNESEAVSKDLKKRGFNFVGSTICYAFMQSVGMVNDHLIDCSFK